MRKGLVRYANVYQWALPTVGRHRQFVGSGRFKTREEAMRVGKDMTTLTALYRLRITYKPKRGQR